MEKESHSGQMVKDMMANTKMTRSMAMVSFNGRTEESMKENGIMENSMVEVK